MSSEKRIAVIGAGHNGLVAACYLADAGHQVTIFEANSTCGGLCINEEIFPGVIAPSIASFAGMFRQEILATLELSKYGLEFFIPDEPGLYLFPDGTSLCLDERYLPSWISETDREALQQLDSETELLAGYLDSQMMGGVLHRQQMIAFAKNAGLFDWAEQLFSGTWHQFLSSRFTNPYLIAALSTNTSLLPDMPGSVFSYLLLCCAQINGQEFSWGRCRGGMGNISAALEQASLERNVTIHLNTSVLAVEPDGDRFILSSNGLDAQFFDLVLSGASPQATINLLDMDESEWNEYQRKVRNLEAGQNSAKIHFLLSKTPLTITHQKLNLSFRGNTMLVPSSSEIAQLFRTRSEPGISLPLIYSTAVQSVLDPSLAPGNQELFSVDLHYCPLTASNEKPWTDETSDEIVESFISSFKVHCPQFRSLIQDTVVVTPQEIDRRFHLHGGGCWHVAGVENQHCEQRPVSDRDSYRTPVKGFYLCGAGTFPGGTVTGVPGHNCAQLVLKDLQQWEKQ